MLAVWFVCCRGMFHCVVSCVAHFEFNVYNYISFQIGLVLLTPPIEVFVWSLASVYARAFPPFTWFPLLFFSTFFALWTLQVVRAISAVRFIFHLHYSNLLNLCFVCSVQFVMAGATSILVLNNCYANTAELSIIWGISFSKPNVFADSSFHHNSIVINRSFDASIFIAIRFHLSLKLDCWMD
jgi:hypothetical protein